MAAAADTFQGTTLPLSWRLRRAALVALLLGLWAPVKIVWELHIAHEQDYLRYRGVTVTRQLRDELGQGLTIGVLSGMRSVVADLIWLETVSAWMNQDWFEVSRVVTLCTALQPRAPMFWDIGGWHLAWNASVDAAQNVVKEPDELKRLKAKRYWIDRGLDLYQRGLANNPTNWRLWIDLGILYQQRLKDYPKAAEAYRTASLLPNAPIYVERAPAEMYGSIFGNDPQMEYKEWAALWNRLTPEQRKMKAHTPDRLEKEIRWYEQKLSIPKEKRIFPN
jgi:tetratricopeptide (TPR) repeat protein